MHVTIPVYINRIKETTYWSTLGLGRHTHSQKGRNAVKIQSRLVERLRKTIGNMPPKQLETFQFPHGIGLERLHLELTIKDSFGKRKITGRFPVIVEPKWISKTNRITIVYHPSHQDRWFPLEDPDELEQKGALFFQTAWQGLDDEYIETLKSTGKDRIKAIAFNAQVKSLLDQLPDRKKSIWDDLKIKKDKHAKKKSRGFKVLNNLGIDLTQKAADRALTEGMPRCPYQRRMQLMLTGKKRHSVMIVGAPRSGKTSIIFKSIYDLLEADAFEVHRNPDRVTHVWEVSGQQLISGMSYLGDWEQRCMDLLEDVKRNRVILYVPDLYTFGRLGRTRDSERNLADFFRGPVNRGTLTIVSECTAEQLQKLEEDAPSFAALFSRLNLQEASMGETLQMMLHECRILEREHQLEFDSMLFRPILKMAASLFSTAAFPGKALDLIRELGKKASLSQQVDVQKERYKIGTTELFNLIRQKTGLPLSLLKIDQPLDAANLKADFEAKIMGQDFAVETACDLIFRIRAALTDPGRPFAVYLFSGPTGTGKTELAKCLAQYLYGSMDRLIRFDMGEFSGADATPRLIGDQWRPRGILTNHIQQQPFSVLLFDEIEKANPLVLNLLLQLFDEGRLTDAAGHTADFTHTTIIMTSNLGAKHSVPVGFGEDEGTVISQMLKAIKEFFPPELFNRIDRVVPFVPLSHGVARKIASKELILLLNRRGLIERNIFVHPTDNVIERIVSEGFDPRYGARTLKRYLENRIGTLLSEEISAGVPSAMQLFHLYTDKERAGKKIDSAGFHLYRQTLTEAPQEVLDLPLEPFMESSMPELRKQLPGMLDKLDEMLESEQLEKLSDEMSRLLECVKNGSTHNADQLYNLDMLRRKLKKLKGKTGHFHIKKMGTRAQLLETMAEVLFMQRALEKADDTSRHAVFIEIMHVGLARRVHGFHEQKAGLIYELATAYQQVKGEVESYACRYADGGYAACVFEHKRPGDLDIKDLQKNIEHVVLKIVGLNVLDFFEGEDGCHIRRSLSHGSDILRVRVRPADADEMADMVLDRYQKQLDVFHAALERGETDLPENPEQLLPLVREYYFDPPRIATKSAPLEIVDHALGYAATFETRTIKDGLKRIRLLRMGAWMPSAPDTPTDTPNNK